MTLELIKYIKNQLELGASREQLIGHLVAHGWSEEVVRDLMDDVIEPPAPDNLRKFALPSATLIVLVVALGFLVSNNNITGTSTYDPSSAVCLYKTADSMEKLDAKQCCEGASLISNCEEVKSAYYVNGAYKEFAYSCDYKQGKLMVMKETVTECGITSI